MPDNPHDDLLARQARSDARAPAAYQPVEAPVEIAHGKNWSFRAWRTRDGFCLAHTRANGGSAYTSGRIPDRSAGVPSYVVAISGTPATTHDGCGFIGGLVLAAVSRVDVELRGGTVVSAETVPSPEALSGDLRTFAILTPFDGTPFGSSARACTLLGSAGQALQRLTWRRDDAAE